MVKIDFDFKTLNKSTENMQKIHNYHNKNKINLLFVEMNIYRIIEFLWFTEMLNHSFHRNFAHRFSRNRHPRLSSAQNRSHLQLKKSSDLNPSLTLWKKKNLEKKIDRYWNSVLRVRGARGSRFEARATRGQSNPQSKPARVTNRSLTK